MSSKPEDSHYYSSCRRPKPDRCSFHSKLRLCGSLDHMAYPQIRLVSIRLGTNHRGVRSNLHNSRVCSKSSGCTTPRCHSSCRGSPSLQQPRDRDCTFHTRMQFCATPSTLKSHGNSDIHHIPCRLQDHSSSLPPSSRCRNCCHLNSTLCMSGVCSRHQCRDSLDHTFRPQQHHH